MKKNLILCAILAVLVGINWSGADTIVQGEKLLDGRINTRGATTGQVLKYTAGGNFEPADDDVGEDTALPSNTTTLATLRGNAAGDGWVEETSFTIAGDGAFTSAGSGLVVGTFSGGVDKTTRSIVNLYGDDGTNGAQLNLVTGATDEAAVDKFRLTTSNALFRIYGVSTVPVSTELFRLTPAGVLTITGGITGDDLTSVDDVAVGDDLVVTGLATVGETLTVTGLSSLDGGIDVNGANYAVSAAGDVTHDGDLTINNDRRWITFNDHFTNGERVIPRRGCDLNPECIQRKALVLMSEAGEVAQYV